MRLRKKDWKDGSAGEVLASQAGVTALDIQKPGFKKRQKADVVACTVIPTLET